MAIQPYQEDSEVSNPIKRIRWATHRAPGQKGERKRQSLVDRIHNRAGSKEKADLKGRDGAQGQPSDSGSEGDQEDPARRVFFNIPLPPDARDEEGRPLVHYPRNKIRTAKYTPLSFLPKNLWFQFQNIANVYFLFIIILSVSASGSSYA